MIQSQVFCLQGIREEGAGRLGWDGSTGLAHGANAPSVICMERCRGERDAAHRSRSGRGLVCPQDVPFQLAFPCPVPGSALGSTPSACDCRFGGGGGLGWVGLTVTLSTSVSRGGAAVTARGQLGL